MLRHARIYNAFPNHKALLSLASAPQVLRIRCCSQAALVLRASMKLMRHTPEMTLQVVPAGPHEQIDPLASGTPLTDALQRKHTKTVSPAIPRAFMSGQAMSEVRT
jgi:hypothetical protein